MRIEDTILSGLITDEEYARKVVPHLDVDYFAERADALIYNEFQRYFLEYNSLPSKEVLVLQINEKCGISISDVEEAVGRVVALQSEVKKLEWLVEKTESFCRDRALYNAIMKSITIIDGKDRTNDRGAIPEILQRALGISFNTAVGHQYVEDAAARYDYYTRLDSKIRMDLDILNRITDGGLSKKSLTLLLAISGGGKSLVMSHLAAGFLREGYNTLYISLEMSEEKIAERIDANLMGVDLDKIKLLGKDLFCTKITNIAAKTQGRLFIKEYPNGSAHTGHFRGLVEELKTKQNFVPDVILVDYLGICASSRMKLGGSVNSYAFLKSISEELRALAVELDLPLITAGQVNRGAYGSSDIDLSDTQESMGVIHQSDIVLGLVRTEELDSMNQLMITQLKNRYQDPASNKRFIVGLNRSQMRLTDINAPALTPDATDRRYEPRRTTSSKKEVQDEPSETKSHSSEAIHDMMDNLPTLKPKSLNTEGFAF